MTGERGLPGGLLHNMSAPPRSKVNYTPYGMESAPARTRTTLARASGLRHLLRADPRKLLEFHLPDLDERCKALNRQARDRARAGDREASRRLVGESRRLRRAGILHLAAGLAGDGAPFDPRSAEGLTQEAFDDRLLELAEGFPPRPAWLPAMALVDRAPDSPHGPPPPPPSADLAAVLWAITHVNGDTCDFLGQPMLGDVDAAMDLYAL